VGAPANQEAASDVARAIASPIHAPHRVLVEAAPVTAPPPTPKPAVPVQKPQQATETAVVERPQAEVAPSAPAQAPRHIHRVVERASAANTRMDTPTQSAQGKPAAPAKAGDVPLF
jgi:hypothetical protein